VVEVRQGMNTLVGTAGAEGGDRFPEQGGQGCIECQLHRWNGTLKLRAMEGGAIIHHLYEISCHNAVQS